MGRVRQQDPRGVARMLRARRGGGESACHWSMLSLSFPQSIWKSCTAARVFARTPSDGLREPCPRRAHLIEITNAEPPSSNVHQTAKPQKSRRPRARSRETARRSPRSRRISAIFGRIDGARRRLRGGRGAAAPGPRPGEASCKNRHAAAGARSRCAMKSMATDQARLPTATNLTRCAAAT